MFGRDGRSRPVNGGGNRSCTQQCDPGKHSVIDRSAANHSIINRSASGNAVLGHSAPDSAVLDRSHSDRPWPCPIHRTTGLCHFHRPSNDCLNGMG